MKLAFITSQFPETYETFILREFREVEKQGIEFSIFSLKECRDEVIHPEAKKLLPRTRRAMSPVIRLICRNFAASISRPFQFWGLFFRIFFTHLLRPVVMLKAFAGLAIGTDLALTLRRDKFTHIHAHWMTVPATVAIAASRLTGIPFSVTAHAWDIFTGDNLIIHKTRHAKFISTCTAFNKKYLESLVGVSLDEKVFVNYHGVEKSNSSRPARHSEKSRPAQIFAAGRLVPQKGFEVLIDALKMLAEDGMDFRCTIAGEGPLRHTLEQKLADSDLEEKVSLPGTISYDRIVEHYIKADMFVMPSVVTKSGDRDGIPNVLIEAMAHNCPVISTNVSGIPELVEDRKTGLATAESDAPALVRAIKELAEDPELGRQLADEGQRRVEAMFNLEKNVKQFIDLLRKHAEV